MSYAASLGSFAVFFCGVFVFRVSLSTHRFSLYFVYDTTERDDGNDKGNDDDGCSDDVDKTSVNDRLDTVDGVDENIEDFDDKDFFIVQN